MSRPVTVLALLALVSLGHSAVLQAGDVQWRHDYNSARREATEAGKPLLLDFGTAACFWCKKLDATTFRAQDVVDRINRRFIPVKIDAERAMGLVQAIGIQSYPTLIVAAPAGQVLGRQEGYLDASAMAQFLDGAYGRMPPRPSPVVPVAAMVAAPAPETPPVASPTQDTTREEIQRKLTQVYLDRGLDLCRRGRPDDGGQYFHLATMLSPNTPEAATARDLLRRLQAGEELPR